MSSRLWLNLRSQVSLIEKTYITFGYDPLGNYSAENLLNAASYVLLVHAEIETYFEECVRRTLRKAEVRWMSGRKSSKPLIAVCVFTRANSLPEKYSIKDELGNLALKSLKDADAIIAKNHGVKEVNIIPLIHLSGFQVDQLDPMLIAELDVIGSIRGDHAHKSARHHFKAKFDPFAIQSKVEATLKLIKEFDDDFTAYYFKQFGR